VPQIQASTYNAAEAFVVFDNHRRNDWTPYVFHTNDFGKTWKRLVDEKKVWGYALAIAQDAVEPKLLFLGTEFGLYVSIDGGENWTKWKHGYPTVSTMDLVIHPREHDLVIGTFGRAAYVLDDIRPLRALARQGIKLLDRPLHVFEVPDAVLAIHKQAAGTRFAAEAEFAGENRPHGALITYAVKPDTIARKTGEATNQKEASSDTLAKADSVKIEILNAAGKVIRTFKAPAKAGINRTAWDLSRKGVRNPNTPKPKPGAPEPDGPPVLPGAYTVRISQGEHKDSTKVNVKLDPRLQVSEADLQARNAMIEQLMSKTEVATEAADRLREAQKTIESVAERIKERKDETAKTVKDKGKAMQDSIKALLELINPKEVQGIRRDPFIVSSRLGLASNYLRSASEAPGETERIAVVQATESLQKALAKINAFFEREWPAYQQAVEAAEVSWFEKYEPLQIK
jgi:hypothetical protein